MAGKEHSAGRVLLIPKGVFTIGTNYTPLDFVAFGSNNYVCKSPTDGTKTPVEDTASWQLLAAGFDSHNIATEYSESATYHAGDICLSGGNLYKAKQDINVAEAFTVEHWEEITVGHELTAIEEKIGTVALTTTATDLSGAVNEVKTASDTNASAITKLNSDLNFPGAGAHNSIYRGKNLGTSVTTEQYSAIADGTFNDLYIGDYWTINDVVWRIAGFDYWLNVGDEGHICTAHHVVIVPDKILYSEKMNPSNTTTGGYAGSAMYKTGLENAKNIISSAFGTHILTTRKMLTNAVSGSAPSGRAWFDSTVDLMNEVMVYGSIAWGAHDGNGYNVGEDDGQLPLFSLNHNLIHNRDDWWLRDVVSASYFAKVSNNGYSANYNAIDSVGVRPAFAIKG